MTPHLLDLEKCVPPEGDLFVLVIPFYYYTIKILCHVYRYTLSNFTVLGCLTNKLLSIPGELLYSSGL
jgi:hypothetical protein